MENTFPMIIRRMNIPNFIIAGNMNGNNTLQRSFDEQKPKITPLCHKYKSSLQSRTLNSEELSQEINCSICQEIIKSDEKIIELPCEGQSHYFHIGEKGEDCGGIFPWFEQNNNCPVCRFEFPAQPEPEPEPENSPVEGAQVEQEQEEQEEQGEISIIQSEITLTPDQIAGLEREQVEINNRIRNEIDTILRIINLPVQENNDDQENNEIQENNDDQENNDEQENNEDQENNEIQENTEERQGERRNNSLLNINMMNQMFINSMMRDIQARAEEDDLQEAIMRSIEDS